MKRAADQIAPVALDDLAHRFDPAIRGEDWLARQPMIGPYLLLAGLAIEALAKAVLVDRDPSRVHDGMLDRWQGGAHPVPDICKLIGVPWTADERDLFDRLSEEVTWVSKYPIPLKEADLLRRVGRVGGVESEMRQDDPVLVDRVWSTLQTVLDEQWLAARPERAAEWRAREVAKALNQNVGSASSN
jgi:hypothetical protein